MLKGSEATSLAKEYGPFTVDTSGVSLQVEGEPLVTKSARRTAFLRANVQGQNVLLTIPFRRAGKFLTHYLEEKAKDPVHTSAVIILPKLTNQPWWQMTKRFLSIKEYPKGSKVFSTPAYSSDQPSIYPSWPWATVVYWDAPASPDSARPTTFTYMTSKESNLIRFVAKIQGVKVQCLLDSGAEEDFINSTLVDKLHLPFITIPGKTIQLGGPDHIQDGSRLVPHLKYRICNFRDKRAFTVTPLAHDDLILGKKWLTDFDPDIRWVSNVVRVEHHGQEYILHPPAEDTSPTITLLSALQIKREFRKGKTIYLALVQEVDESATASVIEPDIEGPSPEWRSELTTLLKKYHLIFKELPAKLPPEREVDHHIDLEPGAKPPFLPTYHMSPRELEELKKQLTELIDKGFIQPSKSPYGAPILFVPKKNGKLRMCVDYRALNKITIRNRYPLPRIDELLDRLHGATIFTKLDLQSGYHQIRIAPQDVPKTAFRTRYGHYEWKVMPFGLTNAPATFQTLMNNIMAPCLDKFVIVFLDDICIYSKTSEDHLIHIDKVLSILQQHQLYVGLDKSAFGQHEISFLGHVISADGVKPDPKKVLAVQEWPAPKTVREVRAFLGLTGYYRKFIRHYAHIALPLTELTKEGNGWQWRDNKEGAAFEELKTALTTSPVLVMPDPDRSYEVYTDASDFALGAVLLQNHGNGLQPVAYLSRKLNPAERRYPVGDKELLGILHALMEWRCYLEGTNLKVNSDHLNHTWFHKKRADVLTRRQAKWLQWMESYYGPVPIEYKEGKSNLSDPLSRRPDLATLISTWEPTEFITKIQDAYQHDPYYDNPVGYLAHHDGLWYLGDRIAIPNSPELRKEIMYEYHDSPSAGHLGVTKTIRNVSRRFWWPHMHRTIRAYIRVCSSCQRRKPSNQLPGGLLQPLPTPNYKWEQITMDLITDLPPTKTGYDSIVTFVDRLSKQVHFAPTTKTVDAPNLAKIFRQHIFRHHGMPKVIISDRDDKFTSAFWRSLFGAVGTELRFSTAYHPQTDGQSERANRTLEDILRHYINPLQDDWDDKLDLAEFAINNSVNPTTGYTPFYLAYGLHPPTALDLATNPLVPASDGFLTEIKEALDHARHNITEAQLRQADYANRQRRDVTFQPGDKVRLSTNNLRLPSTMTKKFADKYIGPLEVEKQINPVAYKLKLPSTLRIHPVFHVSLLQPWHTASDIPHPDTTVYRPPPVVPEDNQWLVDRLLDKRTYRGTVQYLVRWLGYGPEEDSWVNKEGVEDSLIETYEATHHATLPTTRHSTRKSRRRRT